MPSYFSERSRTFITKLEAFGDLLKKNAGTIGICVFLIAGLFVLCTAIQLPKALDSLEMILLDFRLKARAEHLTPSENIIVATMDKRTQDEARNHPELGIYSRVLPRRKVADIITFFAQRGAKAIIMDLSFQEPQTPEDDRALGDAIKKAGNVYLATSLELPLSEYKARQQANPDTAKQDFIAAFTNYRLLPYIETHKNQAVWMATGCIPIYWGQGLDMKFNIAQSLKLPPTLFQEIWQSRCNSLNNSIYKQTSISITKKEPLRKTDPLGTLYRQQCTQQMYQQVFKKNPEYLHLLDKMKAPINSKNASVTLSENQSYCLISAILEALLANSRGLGITSVNYDRDAIVREIPLLYQGYKNNIYAYLGFIPVLNEYSPLETSISKDSITLKQKTIPLQENGQVMINWRSPKRLIEALAKKNNVTLSTREKNEISSEKGNRELGYGHLYRMVSTIDILKQMHKPQKHIGDNAPSLYQQFGKPESGLLQFKDKIIVYGDAIEDLHRTPVGNRIYGAEIVASTLDMLMNDQKFIQHAPRNWVWVLTLLLTSLIFYSQIASPRLIIGFISGMTLIILYWVYDIIIFIQAAYWFPLVIPSLVLGLTMVAGLLYRYYIHDREKHQLTHVFSRYVSPQVMEEILTDPHTSLKTLAGVEKNLTVLFADLKGFTERFTTEDPQIMVKQLNEFFTVMTRIILKHQGTYDKYIGDCIMAFFGAPAEVPNHAEKACAAALEMQAALIELNNKWQKAGIRQLHMGIGLSSGEMIVGNFGSEDLQNFTVMGNAVNLGSRLESLTRKVNAPIVISQETMRQAGSSIQVKDLGIHDLKGFSNAIQAYALEDWFPKI